MSNSIFMKKLLDGVAVEWKTIGEVFDLKNGYTPSKANTDYWTDGEVPWFRIEDIRANGRVLGAAIQSVSSSAVKGRLIPANSLIMSTTATLGEHALIEVPFLTNQQITSFTISNSYDGKVDVKFMFHCFFEFGKWCSENANKNGGMGIIGLSKLKQFKVPIPCPENPKKSLEIQAEIVRILDAFSAHTAELTAELTARKKQYNYYRDKLLSFEEGEVEWKTLDYLCSSISAGGDLPENYIKGQTEPSNEFPYPIYANATGDNGLYGFTNEYKIESDAVTISARGAKIGYHTVRGGKFTPIIRLITLVPNKSLISTRYLNYALDMTPIGGTDGGIPQLTVPTVKKISIPVPFSDDIEKSLAEQARIVSILDRFDTLITSITEGLPREIELRQKQYEYYRDLLLSFPKAEEAAA